MPERIRNYERDLRRLREARARFADELLSIPGVHGLGIGRKRTSGEKTSTLALVLHVYRKIPADELEDDQMIPRRLRFHSENEKRDVTVRTDVVEKPPPVPEVACGDCGTNFEVRARPTPGGYSIGLDGVPGGTLGGWVWDNTNDETVLISNEHVLGSTADEPVIQPSAMDNGSFPADDLARVVRAGKLDVAIARPIDGDDISLGIECSGPAVYEIADAEVDMVVEKVGQTTGLTCGIVELINYKSGHYGSQNDLWIDGDGKDFSQDGDSGSLYAERTHPDDRSWKRIVGIHWGGSGNDGIGHPIRAVFTDVDVTTVCAGVVEAVIESLWGPREEEEAEVRRERVRQPFGRRRWSRRGLARDMEKRLREWSVGREVTDLMRVHRADVVRVLLSGDGRRAAQAFLAPIVGDCITTDEILERTLTTEDVERGRRLTRVAARVAPDLADAVELVDALLDRALDRPIGSLVAGRRPRATDARTVPAKGSS